MLFNEAVAAVQAKLKRPEKTQIVMNEINDAINFFSSDLNSNRDVEEILLSIDPVEYTQAIPLTSLPRYRKMQYIRRSGTRKYLTYLDVKKMFTTNCDMQDKWYLAGSSIKISMTELASALDIGYYQYPPILTMADGNNSHWLLDQAWPVIVNRTLAKCFADIGDMQESAKNEGYAVAGWLSKRADLEAEAGQ